MVCVMRDDRVPSIDILLAAVVNTCRQQARPLTAREIDDDVALALALPADVVALPHSSVGSRTELAYRLAWARSKGKGAGVLTRSSDGMWEAVIR